MTQTTYYWILAVDMITGRPVVLGPHSTEAEANEIGFKKIGASFEVVPLNTRDINAATKMMKHRRFMQTEQLHEAVLRAKHKV